MTEYSPFNSPGDEEKKKLEGERRAVARRRCLKDATSGCILRKLRIPLSEAPNARGTDALPCPVPFIQCRLDGGRLVRVCPLWQAFRTAGSHRKGDDVKYRQCTSATESMRHASVFCTSCHRGASCAYPKGYIVAQRSGTFTTYGLTEETMYTQDMQRIGSCCPLVL